MPPDDERDYEVGYGKPPRHSRFVKGQSGNPRGRPPGAKNLVTLLNKALNELVIVTEDGGRRKITKPSRSCWRCSATSRAVQNLVSPTLTRSPRPTRRSSNGSGHGSAARRNEARYERPFAPRIQADPALGSGLFC